VDEVKRKLQRLRSVGRALPNTEIKIVDHEEQEVAPGDIGEIMVRNSKMMKGYSDQDVLTRKALVDGWLHTSILAWQDEDGYVFHVGRKDNLVISNEGDVSTDDVDSLLLYPQAPRYEGQRSELVAGAFPQSAKLELQNVVQLDCFLSFLNRVSEAQDVHSLRENYLAAIPQMVTASAYGFMLLEPQGSLSSYPSLHSQLRDSAGRDEEAWLAHEPVSLNIVWRWHPSRESQVFWDGGRHNQDCQHLSETHELMRFVRVPIGPPGGRLVGALSFARAACQPPFDKRDLEIIRLVAQQMFQPVSHALKNDEMKERFASAEGALEAMGTAVIVTDNEGRVKFANTRAQKLMYQTELGSSVANAVRTGVQDNLSEIGSLGKRVATTDVRLPNRSAHSRNDLVLRSVLIPSSNGAVATFLYAQEEIPTFQHLMSILSKREIEVLELLAQGFQNREIADILVVTPHTVKYHLNQMFRKMQVNSRSELLAKVFSSSPHS
jgi:DNA-binding CsgD family transcriptional regulator/PAS domain-containing protein